MFSTVLVANRGEIAVRVIRTLRKLGIRSVAVFSDADQSARHVAEADLAVRLGPAPATQSYLSVARIIDAALASEAEAIHPGYGFLSENPALAEACAASGITFVGPPVGAMFTMGDKIRAKQAVAAAGVPVVPGRSEPGMDDEALATAAKEVGFPVLLKPSAGGGGKGMRRVDDPDGLADAIAGARREARAAFGDDTLLVERYLNRPRHLEVQVLADTHGSVLHLGERECSLQRRHQKIVEEAPSPLLDDAARADLAARATAVARACGYVGAGTVEFVVSHEAPTEVRTRFSDGGASASSPDVDGGGAQPHGNTEPYFLEMNTRLQVEHAVTEMIFDVDLVEMQLRVAAGEPLPISQDDLRPRGHAVEARVYAEDPARGFLPTGGTVLALAEPSGPGIRVDSSLATGTVVGTDYDPMLAKVIARGRDRAEALARLDAALAATAVLGVPTNVAWLRALLAHPDVAAGRLHTNLVDEVVAEQAAATVPDAVLAAAALTSLGGARRSHRRLGRLGRWDVADGWRLGHRAWARWQAELVGGDRVEVWVRRDDDGTQVRLPGREPQVAMLVHHGDGTATVYLGEMATRVHLAGDGTTSWVGTGGGAWAFAELEPVAPGEAAAAHGGVVRSPMPGSITAVAVGEGDHVRAGQALVVVEAMKMEHTLVAPCDGVVRELSARVGRQVALDEVLAVVQPQEEHDDGGHPGRRRR